MKYAKILVTLFVVAAANSFATHAITSWCGTFSADGSKVAYLSNEVSCGGATHTIYTANADGSGRVELEFERPDWVYGKPYFSPDGKKIASVSEDRWSQYGNICLVDVDGKNLRQLTDYGDDAEGTDADEPTGVLDEGLTFYLDGQGLTFSPDGRSILYLSNEFGSRDIFAVNVDGTGKTRLTSFAEYDESGPVFLAGGEEILFAVAGSGEKGGIWIMNADGSGKKKLFGGVYAELVAVSPDGKKLAYAERRGQDYDSYKYTYYVSDLDGSSRFKVATVKPWFLYLSFSPDGKKVLYRLYDGINVVNADGTGRKNLTPAWDFVYKPAFFAGGAKIAFTGSRRRGDLVLGGIWTMDADGSNLELFTVTDGMNISDLVVSPAGDKFLFSSSHKMLWGRDYFVVNVDGSGLARLAMRYFPYNGEFSPDGSKIAYLSNDEDHDYSIYTVNADGTGKVKFELEGGLWGEPYFSPAGERLAFINYYKFFQKGNIFLVDVDGQNLRQLTNYGDAAAEITDDTEPRIGVLDERLTFAPDGRKILFSSDEFGSLDIFSVNVDGTGKTRLTAFAGCDESGPVFLPGGYKILFAVSDGEEKSGSWVMDADGSAKKRLPVPVNNELVAVSPDGKRIAFCTFLGQGPRSCSYTDATYVAALDGSSAFKVADEYPERLNLSFSPDGKKVVYELRSSVYTINADGSGRKNLTPGWYSVYDPAFFADGAKIAFKGTRRLGDLVPGGIWTMDADGSNPKLFKATEDVHIRSLAVSPTGDRFLFRGEFEDVEGAAVDYFVVNADGSGLTRLTKTRSPFEGGLPGDDW